ncbi:MAG: hypothetical protein N2443_03880 [Blastocatellia bacterium]|nr:hypothetical protein [Blastocatellia bacterium]
MAEELAKLVEGLKAAHGAQLVSVVLYGSAVTGDFDPERSNYNVLVVLQTIAPEDLRAARPVIEDWQARGHPLPLYFTREEMADASDVFPMEFLDMSAAHRVLYGEDPFLGLDVPTVHLRHQLEYELRGKLIRLRELYIPASHSAERVTALMADSIVSFVVLFRHVLRLFGISEPPLKRQEVVQRLGETLSLDVTPFQTILDLRQAKRSLPLEEADRLFAAYVEAIRTVIERVDHLEVRP